MKTWYNLFVAWLLHNFVNNRNCRFFSYSAFMNRSHYAERWSKAGRQAGWAHPSQRRIPGRLAAVSSTPTFGLGLKAPLGPAWLSRWPSAPPTATTAKRSEPKPCKCGAWSGASNTRAKFPRAELVLGLQAKRCWEPHARIARGRCAKMLSPLPTLCSLARLHLLVVLRMFYLRRLRFVYDAAPRARAALTSRAGGTPEWHSDNFIDVGPSPSFR